MIREKIIGGLLGKAIGGTLGQPFEGCTGPLALTFYDPVPTGMIPNDDLDLQILWMCSIDSSWNGVLNCENFARTWRDCMGFHVDEYGVANRNLTAGLLPPWSGSYDNGFVDGLGAAIRSEIWAFLAPGDPALAVRYAEYDAQVDHAGDGVYAECFWSALESMAFRENRIEELVGSALQFIPADCRLVRAVRHTVEWCRESQDPVTVRRKILECYGTANFTDCVMNAGFTVMALLLGQGNFGRTICLAANCGRDTDCTAATAGAVLGIIAPDSIGEEWIRPIGRTMLVSREITGINPPPTIDGFADLILRWQGKIVCGALRAPEPDWDRYRIKAKTGVSEPNACGDFTRSGLTVPQWRETELPGNLLTVDFTDVPHDCFRVFDLGVNVPEDGEYQLCVSSRGKCVVTFDGEFQFAQACGNFVPGTHRALVNQHKRLHLASGKHRLRIALAAAEEEQLSSPLLFTLTDRSSRWVVNAFERNNGNETK